MLFRSFFAAAVLFAANMSIGTSPVHAQVCTATGSNLQVAQQNYSRQCSLPRRDCDPVSGGWACSSANISSSNNTSTANSNSSNSSSSNNNNNSSGGHPAYATRSQPWADSYSVGSQCFCSSNYDHGLNNKRVATRDGTKTVRQICDAIRAQRGTGGNSNRVYYNTVQCGHGPANDAPDERVCPGIPIANGRYSGPYCFSKGATWNTDSLFSGSSNSTPVSSGGACTATGSNLNNARSNYARQCSLPRRDCDRAGGGWTCSSQNI